MRPLGSEREVRGRRAARRRQQPRPRRARARGQLPRRPLPPPVGVRPARCRRCASASTTSTISCRAIVAEYNATVAARRVRVIPDAVWAALQGLRLARQRARAAQRHRALRAVRRRRRRSRAQWLQLPGERTRAAGAPAADRRRSTATGSSCRSTAACRSTTWTATSSPPRSRAPTATSAPPRACSARRARRCATG